MSIFAEVSVTDSVAHGGAYPVPVRRYDPVADNAAPKLAPTLVWAHGGGFFKGSIDQPEADAVARALAERGIPVVTMDYRLAPIPVFGLVDPRRSQHRGRFPVSADDVATAVHSVQSHAPGRIIVGGASAGACLAAATTLRALGSGSDLRIDGIVLAYGFFHAVLPRTRDIQKRVRGRRRVTHAPLMLDAANINYVGSRRSLSQRLAFPGGHDLRGFPGTLMIDADRDAMRASSERFAHELTTAGAGVERHVFPETRHAFLNRPHLAEFTAAVDLIASWCLRQR